MDETTDALAEFDRAANEARVHNDHMWLPLSAIARLTRAVLELLAEVRKPLADDTLRRAVAEGINRHAPAIVRQHLWRNRMLTAGMVVGALVVGELHGWWTRAQVPMLASLAAGAEQCTDRTDGTRVCWLPVVFTQQKPVAAKR